MCGRYVTRVDAALEREFALGRVRWRAAERFNVAPTQPVPVVRLGDDGVREGLDMRWGLVPFFAHGEPGPYSTINARVESLRSSPAYRGAWKHAQRCLVRFRWRGPDGSDHEATQRPRLHSALGRALANERVGQPMATAFVICSEWAPQHGRLIASSEVREASA